MKVALIHTPYYHQKHMENLDFVSNNFGVFPPVGLMYVSSILKKNGHETRIIDVKAEKLSKEEVLKRLKDFNPDIMGVMMIPLTARITLDWIKFMKSKMDIPVITGNYAMVHYPREVVSNDSIDFGIVGSAREVLPKLLERIESGEDYEDLEGLAFKRGDGSVVVNDPPQITEDLNKLPFPDRDSIDNSLYSSMASARTPFTILVTSYGCKFNCSFCDMGSFGYSERKPDEVVDEIEECVDKYGIKEMDIFDRDFLMNKERSIEICQKIINRNIDIRWSCRTRVDQVNEEILKLMKSAGCRLILYGIESGEQEVLNDMNKGITTEETKKTIELTNKMGIDTLGFFILGGPNETVKDMKKTIEFSKELPLDYAQFFRMIGKPGAKLYEDIKEDLGYDYFGELVKGKIKDRELEKPWTNLSNEEINKWAKKAYKEFYLRPSYILKRFININSLRELKRYINVGFKILKLM